MVLPVPVVVVGRGAVDVEADELLTGSSTHFSSLNFTATSRSPMPRKPPTPITADSMLPFLLTISSTMSPIFSFWALYTFNLISLEPCHRPAAVAVWLAFAVLVVFCANAGDRLRAEHKTAAARYFVSMVVLLQDCDPPAASTRGRAKRSTAGEKSPLRLEP